jgi:cell division protein ZapB
MVVGNKMSEIELLEKKIDKLLVNFTALELQNQALKDEIRKLKDENDTLIKKNQDMCLEIDKVLGVQLG